MYGQLNLALVMMAAMVINLLIAAGAGVMIPIMLERMDRDPVMGSSVLLTAVTDSMGFFVFLGLAAIYLT
jgi:magnesium transporter